MTPEAPPQGSLKRTQTFAKKLQKKSQPRQRKMSLVLNETPPIKGVDTHLVDGYHTLNYMSLTKKTASWTPRRSTDGQ